MHRSSSGRRRQFLQNFHLTTATWFVPIVTNGKNSIEFFIKKKLQKMENNFLKDLQKWNAETQQKSTHSDDLKSNDFSKKEYEFLTERLNVRLSKSELIMLKEKSEITKQSIASLIRIAIKEIQNFKIIIPNADENKTLIEYRTNFSRIKNHFESQLWSDSEREIYKKLLTEIINRIDKYLQK